MASASSCGTSCPAAPAWGCLAFATGPPPPLPTAPKVLHKATISGTPLQEMEATVASAADWAGTWPCRGTLAAAELLPPAAPLPLPLPGQPRPLTMRAPASAETLLPLLPAAGALEARVVTTRAAAEPKDPPQLFAAVAGPSEPVGLCGLPAAKLLLKVPPGAAADLPLTDGGWGGSCGQCSADLLPELPPLLRQPMPPSRLCLGLRSLL